MNISSTSPMLSLESSAHLETQSIEENKYNLRPRARVSPLFTGGVAGALGPHE
jgi:hypothetical protein